jgi:peptidoglycan/LPS O-acetylase OafA/YrhL
MTAMATAVGNGGHSRLIGLDLLRLLAVLLVLGSHMEVAPDDWASPVRPFVVAWIQTGSIGVDLFFVLSGFLVSGLLFAEYRKRNELSITRFYARRAWRIYPPFYLMLGLTLLYSRYVVGYRPTSSQVISEVFFLQSYLRGFWNHTWTLAVEEHFYLAMPLLLAAMVWRNRGTENPFRAVPWFVGVTVVAGIAIRWANALLREEVTFYTHGFNTHLRIDALFFGLLLAYAYHFHPESFRKVAHPLRYGLIAVGVALLGYPAVFSISLFYYQVFAFTHYYLGAAALMVGLLMCEIPRNRATQWLAMLGTYSYSIYLWHMTMMTWGVMHLRGSASWQMRQTLYLVAALVVGVAMAKIVEAPLLKLRDRWHPSRTTGNSVVKLEASTNAGSTLRAA